MTTKKQALTNYRRAQTRARNLRDDVSAAGLSDATRARLTVQLERAERALADARINLDYVNSRTQKEATKPAMKTLTRSEATTLIKDALAIVNPDEPMEIATDEIITSRDACEFNLYVNGRAYHVAVTE